MWTYHGNYLGNSGSCLSDSNCNRGRASASVISWRASWWLWSVGRSLVRTASWVLWSLRMSTAGTALGGAGASLSKGNPFSLSGCAGLSLGSGSGRDT